MQYTGLDCYSKAMILSPNLGFINIPYDRLKSKYDIFVPDILDYMANILIKKDVPLIFFGFSKGA